MSQGKYARPTLYARYAGMKARCYNPSHPKYHRYGGRGIEVCEKWLTSYSAFEEDMLPTYKKGMMLDRKDNDGDYTPENCRWANNTQQSRNRQNNVLLTFNGVTQCMAAWADEIGVARNTLRERLVTHGWSVERALTGKRG